MSPLFSTLISIFPASLLSLALSAPGAVAAPAPLDARAVALGFPYGSTKVRGVNLGGWLVLEPWITPSLFDGTGNDAIIDEYTFCQYQDRSVATGKLKQHWDTWITENDIKWISEAGLNHVRVPIGYWAYDIADGEPWINGQEEYLDRVIGWARNHGVKVMVDLHGAPGSQNGYDNSGRRGEAQWAENPANVRRAVSVVERISKKYSDPSYYGVVTSLAMLNEPATYLNNNLLQVTRQYWYDAYGAARYPWAKDGRSDKSGLALIISDGFQPLDTFKDYMKEPEHEGVLIDTHNYQVFDGFYNEWSYEQHLDGICKKYGAYSQSPLYTIVGEWSLASTDCTKYLNGRGIGSRYDGTYPGFAAVGSCDGKSGSGDNFTPEYKEFLRKYFDTQTQVYEDAAQGWVFWTWKAESSAEWSYQAGLSGGWIPYNPEQHVVSRAQVCG